MQAALGSFGPGGIPFRLLKNGTDPNETILYQDTVCRRPVPLKKLKITEPAPLVQNLYYS